MFDRDAYAASMEPPLDPVADVETINAAEAAYNRSIAVDAYLKTLKAAELEAIRREPFEAQAAAAKV